MKPWRRHLRKLAGAPVHPQWLLGPRQVPPGIGQESGLVLDVGAADEWIGRFLGAEARYVSLDYPATGQQLYAARPMVFADAANLPFADTSFDVVVCLEVVEHVPNPARVLQEIRRVLKPGGRAYVSMPFLYPIHDAPHDYSRWTESGWRQMASACGFSIRRIAKRTHAVRTAGLLACLALSAPASRMGGVSGAVYLSLVALPVLAINCMALLASWLVPDWDGMGTGYNLLLVRD